MHVTTCLSYLIATRWYSWNKLRAGADPVSKVRGGDFSNFC